MSLTADFSPEVEAKIDHLCEVMDMCAADVVKRAVGLGLDLYEQHTQGTKILVQRPGQKIRRVLL